jgi:hypothetical protein
MVYLPTGSTQTVWVSCAVTQTCFAVARTAPLPARGP